MNGLVPGCFGRDDDDDGDVAVFWRLGSRQFWSDSSRASLSSVRLRRASATLGSGAREVEA
jgi:hypothetical protein